MLKYLLLLLLALKPLMSQAIEEPTYTVERQLSDQVEVRRYAAYVVAEVVLEATADKAASQAFPILAGYIFGKNKGQRTLEMTAPVTQRAEPLRLEMTAPVTQAAVTGGTRVQFVLPKDLTLATAPEPLDPRVRLREEAPTLRAAIRYSGTWSQANDDEHLSKLQAALAAAGIATEGPPVLARYNAPMTPWFMRRNEIWLTLR